MAFRASPVNFNLINLVKFASFSAVIISLASLHPSKNMLKDMFTPLNSGTTVNASFKGIACAAIVGLLVVGLVAPFRVLRSFRFNSLLTSDLIFSLELLRGIDLVGVKGSNASTSLLSSSSFLAWLHREKF